MQCGGHGVESHPPDESLRRDEAPIVAVRPTSLQLPIDMENYYKPVCSSTDIKQLI